MPEEHLVETDILIIGGGTAGCFAAVKARELGLRVTIVDKACAGKSGSGIMASGYWSVFNTEWGSNHDKTLESETVGGDYINNRDWGEIFTRESYGTFKDLVDWGVEFPVPLEQLKDYYRLNIAGDVEGRGTPALPYTQVPLRHRKVTPILRQQAEKVGAAVLDRVMVTHLLKKQGTVNGAIGFSLDGLDVYIFKAKSVILSAGWNNFKSPGYHASSVTGDSDAMAYRAGATITGKEFQDSQHFNLLNYPAWKGNGELYPAFWYHTDAEGNVVDQWKYGFNSYSFAVHEGRGPILWDFNAATPQEKAAMHEYLRKRGNPIEIARIGLDPDKGGKYQIFGGSAAGSSLPQTTGVWIEDTNCTTGIPGLYVAGDCCCTYLHGAHFLVLPGGLTIAAITGKRAGAAAAVYAKEAGAPVIDGEQVDRLKKVMHAPLDRKSGFSPSWITQLLQNTMMPYFILYLKDEVRLQAALTIVEFLRDHLVPRQFARDAHELRLAVETENMVLNAEMILRASLFRRESRGLHYREDYPHRDDPAWLAWTKIKEENGKMSVSKQPIPREWWPDLSRPEKERYLSDFPDYTGENANKP
jgi:succinate dehydrogenase/fumarate reductase flavoprotein subunit